MFIVCKESVVFLSNLCSIIPFLHHSTPPFFLIQVVDFSIKIKITITMIFPSSFNPLFTLHSSLFPLARSAYRRGTVNPPSTRMTWPVE